MRFHAIEVQQLDSLLFREANQIEECAGIPLAAVKECNGDTLIAEPLGRWMISAQNGHSRDDFGSVEALQKSGQIHSTAVHDTPGIPEMIVDKQDSDRAGSIPIHVVGAYLKMRSSINHRLEIENEFSISFRTSSQKCNRFYPCLGLQFMIWKRISYPNRCAIFPYAFVIR
jgi:hypothetical protein